MTLNFPAGFLGLKGIGNKQAVSDRQLFRTKKASSQIDNRLELKIADGGLGEEFGNSTAQECQTLAQSSLIDPKQIKHSIGVEYYKEKATPKITYFVQPKYAILTPK